ncbi:MAG: response regulator [Desulfitobacteriaceae bacterium]
MDVIRVVIADDHPIYRKGLKAALQTFTDIKIIGEAHSCQESLFLVGQEKPDVLLLDVRLQEENSLTKVTRIKEICPRTKVITLTAYGDQHIIMMAIRFAVHGFLLKDAGIEELVQCIRAVNTGKFYLDPTVTEIVFIALQKFLDHDISTPTAVDEDILSPREREVFILVRAGLSNKKIAEHLSISANTVHNHLVNIYRKLGVSKRRQVLEMTEEL